MKSTQIPSAPRFKRETGKQTKKVVLFLLFALVGFLWLAPSNYAERSSRLSILICGAREKMPLGWNNRCTLRSRAGHDDWWQNVAESDRARSTKNVAPPSLCTSLVLLLHAHDVALPASRIELQEDAWCHPPCHAPQGNTAFSLSKKKTLGVTRVSGFVAHEY